MLLRSLSRVYGKVNPGRVGTGACKLALIPLASFAAFAGGKLQVYVDLDAD